MSVLFRYSQPEAKGIGTAFADHPFTEDVGTVQTEQGPLKYRLYTPRGVSHSGGIVLLHGLHRMGIQEPRLINFSPALAAAGVEVRTPERQDLIDYRVPIYTADMIGESANFLSVHMRKPKVGIVGLSFAGGLALLAAANPHYAPRIGFVLSIGAHGNLARVARFLASDIVVMPDGKTVFLEAHDYGASVIAYSHVEDFFPKADISAAREAVGLWLSERPDGAWITERRLTPEGRKKFEQLLYHRDQLKEQLLKCIELHAAEMAAVSPSGHLRNLTVPVYLLHAASDNVIPPSETVWLSYEIPRNKLRSVLISPAIIHADIGNGASLLQKWRLINFLARVIDEVDHLGETA